MIETSFRADTEVRLWQLHLPEVSVEQELNEIMETLSDELRETKERIREELARTGIKLPSID